MLLGRWLGSVSVWLGTCVILSLRYLKPIVESRYLLNRITPPLRLIQVTTYAAGCRLALGGSAFSGAVLREGRVVLGSAFRGLSPEMRSFFSLSAIVKAVFWSRRKREKVNAGLGREKGVDLSRLKDGEYEHASKRRRGGGSSGSSDGCAV